MIATIYPKCPCCESEMGKVNGFSIKGMSGNPFESNVYLFQCAKCKTVAACKVFISVDNVKYTLV